MSLRQSKAYAGFKAFNGVLFIVFGAAIFVQIARMVGPRIEAVPGLVLGAAMFALGVYRLVLMVRAHR